MVAPTRQLVGRRRWYLSALIAVLVSAVGLPVAAAAAQNRPPAQSRASGRLAAVTETDPQTTWAACNQNAGLDEPSTFQPLSDAAAAKLVTPEPETRPYNARAYTLDGKAYPATNDFVPGWLAIWKFRATKNSNGQTAVQFNPYLQYVDGRDRMTDASTDDLIQWAAHKWGIPEDWLRAEYVLESYWNGFQLGDDTTVSPTWYAEYPIQAQVPGTSNVYQSMGITQVRWAPDGSLGVGSNPLRWESTAFNIDYQAAFVRFFYDDPDGARSRWGDSSYVPCQQWPSIGGWFSSYPWNSAGQASYIADVQADLAQQVWATPNFLDWQPTSFPPGISFP